MIDSSYNFLENIPSEPKNELFEELLKNEKVRIERIVSYGQVTNSSDWYNQEEDEFVLVLSGFAKIKYEDGTIYELKDGSSLYIPSHTKHQVIYTQAPTIWLAIFITK